MIKRNDIPVSDFISNHDLSTMFGIEECLDDLIFFLHDGYFLTWEAVVRQEQGLPLSEKQEDAFNSLLNFTDDDGPILYIDEMPRPSEPWYEIVRKIAPKLLIQPFKTFNIYSDLYHEGWLNLVECLEEYASDLSLPVGASSPIEVIPIETCHKLWLQLCFDNVSGLGQDDELTLENEEQKPWRIKHFIDSLKEFKESIEFFDLSLNDLLKLVILPPKDEKILIASLLQELGMNSSSDKLADVL